MINPTTIEEAQKTTYGNDRSAWGRGPIHWKEGFCAAEVFDPPHYLSSHQCTRKSGHGPAGLYCKQHAKILEDQ